MLFTGEAKGPVLGWTAGVGAYCSALFPALFAAFDDKALCLYIFTIYYVSCLAVNYWCARKPVKCELRNCLPNIASNIQALLFLNVLGSVQFRLERFPTFVTPLRN